MPSWLAHLHEALCSDASPRLVKLFLLKLILHVETRDRGACLPHCLPACPPGSPALLVGNPLQPAAPYDQPTASPSPPPPPPPAAGRQEADAPPGAPAQPVGASRTAFAAHCTAFLGPLVAAALGPPGQGPPPPEAIAAGAFHYLLRDLVLAIIGWRGVMERAAGGAESGG
jgi:hypothetical protein